MTRSSAPHSAPGWRSRGLMVAGIAVGGCAAAASPRAISAATCLPEGALEQIPLGSSQEQVLIVLGTPSTVATVSGEVFYYISQRTQQTAFLPQEEVNRRIIAVYFDKDRKVQRIADYGIRDGKVFDASAAPRRPAARSSATSAT